MSNKEVEECPICLEEYNRLKILKCGHSICPTCIEISSFVGDDGLVLISCPFDQTKTTLKDGKAFSLKTKFFINLPCESCFMNKSVNESWWCETCISTACSDCAMKKHRNHTIKEWNDFDIVKECYALYKNKILNQSSQNSNDVRNSIHEFCISLEEKLLNCVSDEEPPKKAIAAMENAFGAIDHVVYPEGHVVEKIEKKLNSLSKFVQTVSGSDSLPQISNSLTATSAFDPPPFEQLVKLCFKSKDKPDNAIEMAEHPFQQTATAISKPGNSISNPANASITISSRDNASFLQTTGIKLVRIVNYDFDNPACTMCALPDNKVVVFDNRGIHVINVINDKCVKFRQWELNQFDFYCQSTFRPVDSALFLSMGYSKSNGHLFHFDIETLNQKNRIQLPNDPIVGFGYKRLLAVARSGSLLMAVSDGLVSVAWILQKNASGFVKVWQGALEIFWDMQIIGTTLLIAGQTRVYQFFISTDKTVNFFAGICSGCGPLFQMKGNVFQIDTSKKKIRHIFFDRTDNGQNMKDLTISDKEPSVPILTAVDDDTICSISLLSKKLRIFRFY